MEGGTGAWLPRVRTGLEMAEPPRTDGGVGVTSHGHAFPSWGADKRRPLYFAGVVPYGSDARGNTFILLGRERFGREAGTWSAFTGRSEPWDSCGNAGTGGGTTWDPVRTAAREAHEESCGILGPQDRLETLLRTSERLEHSTGVHFFLPFQFSRYAPLSFAGARAAIAATRGTATTRCVYLEKDEIAWFPVQDLTPVPPGPHQQEGVGGPRSVVFRSAFLRDLPQVLSKLREIVTPASTSE